jgi:hypothetical protein
LTNIIAGSSGGMKADDVAKKALDSIKSAKFIVLNVFIHWFSNHCVRVHLECGFICISNGQCDVMGKYI